MSRPRTTDGRLRTRGRAEHRPPRRWPAASRVIGVVLLGGAVLVALAAPLLAPHDPFRVVAAPLLPPTSGHPLGTDGLGRDLWSAVVLGTRTSLIVAAAVTALTGPLGIGIGVLAGYRSGVVDDLLMRLTELVQVLPRFFLAVLVVALFGPGTDRLVVVLGLTSWPLLARVVRASTLEVAPSAYVEAARASGAGTTRILGRHILPNVLPTAATTLGVLLAQVILLEASLGFLGLGDPATVSLGTLAGDAQRFVRRAWWLATFPGLAIVAIVLGVNLLLDGRRRG